MIVYCMAVCHILICILLNCWSVIIRVNEMFRLLMSVWNIEKFWHYFVEISLISWLWYDIRYHLLVDGNFGFFFRKYCRYFVIYWYFYRFFEKYHRVRLQSSARSSPQSILQQACTPTMHHCLFWDSSQAKRLGFNPRLQLD